MEKDKAIVSEASNMRSNITIPTWLNCMSKTLKDTKINEVLRG